MGIDNDRMRLEWISASEGEKVKIVINDMVSKLKKLGPLNLPGIFKNWDAEMNNFENELIEESEHA